MTADLHDALHGLLPGPAHPRPVEAVRAAARRRRTVLAVAGAVAALALGASAVFVLRGAADRPQVLQQASPILAGPGTPYTGIEKLVWEIRVTGTPVVAVAAETTKGLREVVAFTNAEGRDCSTLVGFPSGGGTVCSDPADLSIQSSGQVSTGNDPDVVFGNAPAGTRALELLSARGAVVVPLYRVTVDGRDRLCFLIERQFESGLKAVARGEDGAVIARFPRA